MAGPTLFRGWSWARPGEGAGGAGAVPAWIDLPWDGMFAAVKSERLPDGDEGARPNWKMPAQPNIIRSSRAAAAGCPHSSTSGYDDRTQPASCRSAAVCPRGRIPPARRHRRRGRGVVRGRRVKWQARRGVQGGADGGPATVRTGEGAGGRGGRPAAGVRTAVGQGQPATTGRTSPPPCGAGTLAGRPKAWR